MHIPPSIDPRIWIPKGIHFFSYYKTFLKTCVFEPNPELHYKKHLKQNIIFIFVAVLGPE